MRKCADWIDSYLKLNENTEPPEIFHKWVAISCIAACMQRKCVLPWGDLLFYPNLYVVLIAPPGRARKGTAMRPVMKFLEESQLNIKLAAEAITREQLIRELRDSEEMLTLDDGRLITHSSLTICNSELTVFLGYQNPQLIVDLTDWYDCKDRWRYRTKNAGEFDITNVWINILGATTTDLLRMSLPPAAIGGGLTSRIIFVYAGSKRATIPDPFVTMEMREIKQHLLDDLEQIVALHGEYKPTADYLAAYTEWYMINDPNPPFQDAIFSAYCERRAATVMKLATIMSASHTNQLVVTAGDFLRAVSMLEEVEQNMPMALSGIGQGKYADVMARVMVEISTRKECTMDSLMWKFRNDITHWEMERVLVSLESMGYCAYIVNTHKILYNNGFDKK